MNLNNALLKLFVIAITSILISLPAYANSKHISYTDVGQGKPIVLIHAFPTDQALWKLQQNSLKQHFRIITLDLWGFGKSSEVDGQAITMSEYADEVKELLDTLHISKAVIGGESMGGYIALAFLEKYPVITGEEDILISPQQSKNMHELAKSSKLVVISNAGHLSSLEQPEAWNQAVVGFFRA